MLDIISNRITTLNEQLQNSQQNVQKLQQTLESEKTVVLQLMGHLNEASYLHSEIKKATDSSMVMYEEELHA